MNKIKMFGMFVLLVALFGCNNLLDTPDENLSAPIEEGESGSRYIQSNTDVSIFMDKYIDEYILPINQNGINGYYVRMEGQGSTPSEAHISTSEAMGYGMRIVLQAYQNSTTRGKRGEYRKKFEGLWNVQRNFMDKKGLCSWLIPKGLNKDYTSSSATDGDLDIAYALIMAHTIFGSSGSKQDPYNYKWQAQYILSGLSLNSMQTTKVYGKTIKYILTGDYVKASTDIYKKDASGKYVKDSNGQLIVIGKAHLNMVTRPSDWMLHHFRTFVKFYETEFSSIIGTNFEKKWLQPWKDLIIGTEYLIKKNTFGNGIFPDFIYLENMNNKGGCRITALDQNSVETEQLGEDVDTSLMSWNASRVPWRMAMDYKHSKKWSSKQALKKMYLTLYPHGKTISSTGVEYHLNGSKVSNQFHTAFAAPIAATAIQNRSTYPNIDSLEEDIKILINSFIGHDDNPDKDGYFGDSINMFSLFIMTDNQYVPYK